MQDINFSLILIPKWALSRWENRGDMRFNEFVVEKLTPTEISIIKEINRFTDPSDLTHKKLKAAFTSTASEANLLLDYTIPTFITDEKTIYKYDIKVDVIIHQDSEYTIVISVLGASEVESPLEIFEDLKKLEVDIMSKLYNLGIDFYSLKKMFL